MKNETQEIVTKFLQMKHDQAIAGKISSLSGLEVIMVEIFKDAFDQ